MLYSLPAFASVSISITPNPVSQGKTILVSVSGEGFASMKARFMGRQFDSIPCRGVWKILIPVPLNARSGKTPLHIYIADNGGKTRVHKKSVMVKKGVFKISRYYLKPTKKKLMRSDWVSEDWAPIEAQLIKKTPEKYWSGIFIKPTKGWITQLFGVITVVNNKRTGQHKGMDIAVEPALAYNTSIEAANNGKVVFSRSTRVFGNTIVIDHGFGIFSLYFHLSKLLADEGSMANKGDVIGMMGNTGVSSGPHLHFAMSVHNVRVDPAQWLAMEF